MNTVVLVARLLLAVVFAIAALSKLADLEGSRRTIAAFGVPDGLAAAGGTLLPFAELATAIALIPQPTARWGAVAALGLLAVFIAGITNALTHGRSPDCNCFGQVSSSRVSWRTLVRNGALAVVAGLVAWKGSGSSVAGWTSDHGAAELVASIAVITIGLLVALASRYVRLSRALRRSLYEATTELRSLPSGLPSGLLAPGIELPDIDGNPISLDALCDRGLPIVLVFMSRDCGPCLRLMPDLGRWHAALADRLTFAVVANGTREPRLLAAQVRSAGNFVVLVQEGQEVADMYRVRSTPTAVIVAVDGRIASAQASGPVEIEELVRVTLRAKGEPQPAERLYA
jgi:thiol-disulfide isomerase/thioredoxin